MKYVCFVFLLMFSFALASAQDIGPWPHPDDYCYLYPENCKLTSDAPATVNVPEPVSQEIGPFPPPDPDADDDPVPCSCPPPDVCDYVPQMCQLDQPLEIDRPGQLQFEAVADIRKRE